MTENELLEALREAEAGITEVPDAYTISELVDATGKNADWLRARLRVAIKAGAVEPVRVPRTNLFGIRMNLCAYRFKRAA